MKDVENVELEIDGAFSANALARLSFGQAAWTLLSQNEDAYLKAQHELPDEPFRVFTDIRLNSLTYPLRVCLAKCPSGGVKIDDRLIDDHYQAAVEWISLADFHYYNFSSIFPLWHRGKIGLDINGKRLIATMRAPQDRVYEAYNRLVRKDAKSDPDLPQLPEKIADLVLPHTTRTSDRFRVNFSPRLVANLVSLLEPASKRRATLPAKWDFDGFRMSDFHAIAANIQAILGAWFAARYVLAANGLGGLGYRSAVWVVSKSELVNRLHRYTQVSRSALESVLSLLTFGSSGIRQPDIAIQPLVDLGNGNYALSPFVWLNANVERNLCVLLNQVDTKRLLYDRLKNEKEALLVQEIREYFSKGDLEIRQGSVGETDIDVALVDRRSKHCLCLELKWFIEPAEIREVEQRTQELTGGVRQAKLISEMFERQDGKLMEVLAIDSSFSFFTAVASHNWIGHSDAQNSSVPIIKVWHLLSQIERGMSLSDAIIWLRTRSYLPKEGIDYEVVPTVVECGGWTCDWYGIKPLKSPDL